MVRSDDERLLGQSDALINVSASPFVIASVNAGIPAFGDFVNVVILFAVVSIGLSGVYGGSRTLTALAEQGYAPKIFAYVDRAGRPLYSTALIIAFGPIAYVSLASSGYVVFSWLQSLSGLAALFTWGSICLAHIRFRSAWKYHGHSLDEIPFKAIFGVTGSWIGLLLVIIVLIANVSCLLNICRVLADHLLLQFYTAVAPKDAETFFNIYLAFFVVIAFYLIGFAWKRKSWKKIADIDVDSGLRKIDYEAWEKHKAKRQSWPAWRRVLDKMF